MARRIKAEYRECWPPMCWQWAEDHLTYKDGDRKNGERIAIIKVKT